VSDQGKWFKLWVSAITDPDLTNLSLEDFARWCILGAYLKAHGKNGNIRLTSPAKALCSLFQVPDFSGVLRCISRFPNCEIVKIGEDEKVDFDTVSSETIVSVTWGNWYKYQGDLSTERVKRYRSKCNGLRREEKEEEKRNKKPVKESTTASKEISEELKKAIAGKIDKFKTLSKNNGDSFNAGAFLGKNIKAGIPPEVTNYVLGELLKHNDSVKNLWGYAITILKKEYGNFFYAQRLAEHLALKDREMAATKEVLRDLNINEFV